MDGSVGGENLAIPQAQADPHSTPVPAKQSPAPIYNYARARQEMFLLHVSIPAHFYQQMEMK